jgi:hypothetical protein
MTDAGEDDFVGAGEAGGVIDKREFGADGFERVHDAAKISGAVIEDGDTAH